MAAIQHPGSIPGDAPDGRRRVVIIGGGLSGLVTAFELSRTPELRRAYRVELYQMGHRLGGKLASSRNSAHAYRNEEHGLMCGSGSM